MLSNMARASMLQTDAEIYSSGPMVVGERTKTDDRWEAKFNFSWDDAMFE